MKFTLVRLKDDKRPLCVIGGHHDNDAIFDMIDEQHDPMKCEFTHVNIISNAVCWYWIGGAKTFNEASYQDEYPDEVDADDDISSEYVFNLNIEFSELLITELSRLYQEISDEDWIWVEMRDY